MTLSGYICLMRKDGSEGSRCDWNTEQCKIGSDPSCDIMVNLTSVAPTHCVLELKENGLITATCDIDDDFKMLIDGVSFRGCQVIPHGALLTTGGRNFRLFYPSSRKSVHFDGNKQISTPTAFGDSVDLICSPSTKALKESRSVNIPSVEYIPNVQPEYRQTPALKSKLTPARLSPRSRSATPKFSQTTRERYGPIPSRSVTPSPTIRVLRHQTDASENILRDNLIANNGSETALGTPHSERVRKTPTMSKSSVSAYNSPQAYMVKFDQHITRSPSANGRSVTPRFRAMLNEPSPLIKSEHNRTQSVVMKNTPIHNPNIRFTSTPSVQSAVFSTNRGRNVKNTVNKSSNSIGLHNEIVNGDISSTVYSPSLASSSLVQSHVSGGRRSRSTDPVYSHLQKSSVKSKMGVSSAKLTRTAPHLARKPNLPTKHINLPSTIHVVRHSRKRMTRDNSASHSLDTDSFMDAKRLKGVSFGPALSPERFDKSMPPSTPIKKGAIPVQTALVENTPKSLLQSRSSTSVNMSEQSSRFTLTKGIESPNYSVTPTPGRISGVISLPPTPDDNLVDSGMHHQGQSLTTDNISDHALVVSGRFSAPQLDMNSKNKLSCKPVVRHSIDPQAIHRHIYSLKTPRAPPCTPDSHVATGDASLLSTSSRWTSDKKLNLQQLSATKQSSYSIHMDGQKRHRGRPKKISSTLDKDDAFIGNSMDYFQSPNPSNSKTVMNMSGDRGIGGGISAFLQMTPSGGSARKSYGAVSVKNNSRLSEVDVDLRKSLTSPLRERSSFSNSVDEKSGQTPPAIKRTLETPKGKASHILNEDFKLSASRFEHSTSTSVQTPHGINLTPDKTPRVDRGRRTTKTPRTGNVSRLSPSAQSQYDETVQASVSRQSVSTSARRSRGNRKSVSTPNFTGVRLMMKTPKGKRSPYISGIDNMFGSSLTTRSLSSTDVPKRLNRSQESDKTHQGSDVNKLTRDSRLLDISASNSGHTSPERSRTSIRTPRVTSVRNTLTNIRDSTPNQSQSELSMFTEIVQASGTRQSTSSVQSLYARGKKSASTPNLTGLGEMMKTPKSRKSLNGSAIYDVFTTESPVSQLITRHSSSTNLSTFADTGRSSPTTARISSNRKLTKTPKSTASLNTSISDELVNSQLDISASRSSPSASVRTSRTANRKSRSTPSSTNSRRTMETSDRNISSSLSESAHLSTEKSGNRPSISAAVQKYHRKSLKSVRTPHFRGVRKMLMTPKSQQSVCVSGIDDMFNNESPASQLIARRSSSTIVATPRTSLTTSRLSGKRKQTKTPRSTTALNMSISDELVNSQSDISVSSPSRSASVGVRTPRTANRKSRSRPSSRHTMETPDRKIPSENSHLSTKKSGTRLSISAAVQKYHRKSLKSVRTPHFRGVRKMLMTPKSQQSVCVSGLDDMFNIESPASQLIARRSSINVVSTANSGRKSVVKTPRFSGKQRPMNTPKSRLSTNQLMSAVSAKSDISASRSVNASAEVSKSRSTNRRSINTPRMESKRRTMNTSGRKNVARSSHSAHSVFEKTASDIHESLSTSGRRSRNNNSRKSISTPNISGICQMMKTPMSRSLYVREDDMLNVGSLASHLTAQHSLSNRVATPISQGKKSVGTIGRSGKMQLMKTSKSNSLFMPGSEEMFDGESDTDVVKLVSSNLQTPRSTNRRQTQLSSARKSVHTSIRKSVPRLSHTPVIMPEGSVNTSATRQSISTSMSGSGGRNRTSVSSQNVMEIRQVMKTPLSRSSYVSEIDMLSKESAASQSSMKRLSSTGTVTPVDVCQQSDKSLSNRRHSIKTLRSKTVLRTPVSGNVSGISAFLSSRSTPVSVKTPRTVNRKSISTPSIASTRRSMKSPNRTISSQLLESVHLSPEKSINASNTSLSTSGVQNSRRNSRKSVSTPNLNGIRTMLATSKSHGSLCVSGVDNMFNDESPASLLSTRRSSSTIVATPRTSLTTPRLSGKRKQTKTPRSTTALNKSISGELVNNQSDISVSSPSRSASVGVKTPRRTMETPDRKIPSGNSHLSTKQSDTRLSISAAVQKYHRKSLKSVRTPHFRGVRKMLMTPKSQQSVCVSGLDDMFNIESPASQLIARRSSINVVSTANSGRTSVVKTPRFSGKQRPMNTPKSRLSTNQLMNDVAGKLDISSSRFSVNQSISDISAVPPVHRQDTPARITKANSISHQLTITPRFTGVRQLMKTPKTKNSPRLSGINEIFIANSERKPNSLGTVVPNRKSVASPRLSCVRKLLKTPKLTVSPRVSGIAALYMSGSVISTVSKGRLRDSKPSSRSTRNADKRVDAKTVNRKHVTPVQTGIPSRGRGRPKSAKKDSSSTDHTIQVIAQPLVKETAMTKVSRNVEEDNDTIRTPKVRNTRAKNRKEILLQKSIEPSTSEKTLTPKNALLISRSSDRKQPMARKTRLQARKIVDPCQDDTVIQSKRRKLVVNEHLDKGNDLNQSIASLTPSKTMTSKNASGGVIIQSSAPGKRSTVRSKTTSSKTSHDKTTILKETRSVKVIPSSVNAAPSPNVRKMRNQRSKVTPNQQSDSTVQTKRRRLDNSGTDRDSDEVISSAKPKTTSKSITVVEKPRTTVLKGTISTTVSVRPKRIRRAGVATQSGADVESVALTSSIVSTKAVVQNLENVDDSQSTRRFRNTANVTKKSPIKVTKPLNSIKKTRSLRNGKPTEIQATQENPVSSKKSTVAASPKSPVTLTKKRSRQTKTQNSTPLRKTRSAKNQ